VAVNLTGVPHDRVGRGQAVVRPGQWHRARVVDASLSVLESLDHPVERRGAYAAYIGSGEFAVRLRLLGAASVPAGGTGLVRLWLPVGLPLLPGDRFVLREAGRSETVGGGEVLDVEPVRPASRATPSRSVPRVIAERGWVDAAALERLTGVAMAPTLGRWVVDPDQLDAARTGVRALVVSAGGAGVDVAELDERQRAVLAAGLDGVVVRAGRALDASVAADTLPPDAESLLAALEAAPFSPPDVTGAMRGAARELQRRGLGVEAGPVWFAASAVASATEVVAALLDTQPDGVTVSEVREALGATRKHVVPLLEHLDASGVTRRRGDVRVAGPRLPAARPTRAPTGGSA